MEWKQLIERRFLLPVALCIIIVQSIIIVRTSIPGIDWNLFIYGIASLIFGALVGFSEITSHYRDEPLQAAFTKPGFAYIVLNGLVSLAAFAFLCNYADKLFPVIKGDYLMTAIVAGFGGMTIFRSKLFSFRTSDGKEYAIGPAIVFETFLKIVDQKIDRNRSTWRQIMVFDQIKDLHNFDGVADYILASLPSFQNLTTEQKKEVSDVIDQYRKSPWPDALKCLGLGFAYLNIAGEENFVRVMKNLKGFLNMPVIAKLNPSSIKAGGAAFLLTATGSNFNSGCVVRWNNFDRNTNWGSTTQVTAAIETADITTAGTAIVTVFNPTLGGNVSSSFTFTIDP